MTLSRLSGGIFLLVFLLGTTIGNANNLLPPNSTKPAEKVPSPPPPSLTISILNPSCGTSNGSLSAVVSSGVTPYTYSWSTGANTPNVNGLSPGTYCVTITDAIGDTDTDCITLGTALNHGGTGAGNYCYNMCLGDVYLNPSGGTPPYTYNWTQNGGPLTFPSTGPSVTTGGCEFDVFAVTMTDANGCTTSGSWVVMSITNPMYPNAFIGNITQPTCGQANGSITAAPFGSFGGFTYQWYQDLGSSVVPLIGQTSQTVSNLPPGTYYYGVTETLANNCYNESDPVTLVSVGQPPAITSQPANQSDCPGGNVVFSVAASGSSLSYQWQEDSGSGFTNLSNGGGYSNVTSANLTISGISSGMDGNQYRCLVSNACPNPATSNAASLSVSSLNGSIVSSSNPVCGGVNSGSATASATGGSGALTYSWSGPSGYSASTATASNLGGGTYCVTISDASGCTTTDCVSISSPTALGVSASVTSGISCNGGTNGVLSATPSGGTSPYTYSWSGGGTASSISGLGAANYCVTLTDANGCSVVDCINLTEPAALSLGLLSSTNVQCQGGNDGSALITISGGTAPFNISWPSGGSGIAEGNLTTGTHCVTVTDNNLCSETLCVNITEPTALTVTSSGISATSCPGVDDGSATISASGGVTPYVYAWPNGGTGATDNNLGAGNQCVTVTDGNNCQEIHCITIPGPLNTAPAVTSQSGDESVCSGDNASYSVLASGSGVSFQWQENTGSGYINLSNGGIYSGVTTPSLSLTGVSQAENGNLYRCVISGTCSPQAVSQGSLLHVLSDTTLTGVITTSGGSALTNSWVYLISSGSGPGNPLDSTQTNSSGQYTFQVPVSPVYLYVVPDTPAFSNQLPTYYDGEVIFGDADSINFPDCDSVLADFSTVGSSGGSIVGGSVGGYVGQSQGEGDFQGLPGISILLYDQLGNPLDQAFTAADGYFRFPDLDLDQYLVWVDVVGIDNLQAPTVLLDAQVPNRDSLLFVLRDDFLEQVGAVGLQEIGFASPIRVFPNPSTGQFTLLSEDSPGKVAIRVTDALGRELFLRENSFPNGNFRYEIDLGNVSSGIYWLTIEGEGKSSRHQLMIR